MNNLMFSKSEVQSLLLSKKKFKSLSEARKWVRSHGFEAHKVDETDNYYRFRQYDPDKYYKMRTKVLTDGVKAIIGFFAEKGFSHFRTEAAFNSKADIDALLKYFDIRRHPYAMYVGFKLLHFGVANDNGCIVPFDEAQDRSWSVKDVPIDWEHQISMKKSPFTFLNKDQNTGIIGHVVAEKVIDPSNIDGVERVLFDCVNNEAPFLFALGLIHKSKFRNDSEQILGRFSEGKLKFSMECRYNKLECPECSKVINIGADSEDIPCKHLENYFFFHSNRLVNKYKDELKEAAGVILVNSDKDNKHDFGIQPYILRDYYFTGASIVEFPADEDASAILVGTNKEKLYSNDKNGGIIHMYREFETKDEYLKDIDLHVSKSVEKAKEEMSTQYKNELKSLKQEIETRDQKIKELSEKIEKSEQDSLNLMDEFNNYKTAVEGEKVLAQRLEQLSSINYLVEKDDSEFCSFISSMSEDDFNVYFERQKNLISSLAKSSTDENANSDMTKGSTKNLKGENKNPEEGSEEKSSSEEENSNEEVASSVQKLKDELGKFLKRANIE